MSDARKAYPSDVSDDEWAFAAPYLALMREDAPQREHALRDVFDALRWLVKAGAGWRFLPHDFPPWQAVYQQSRRWLAAVCALGLFSLSGQGQDEAPPPSPKEITQALSEYKDALEPVMHLSARVAIS